MHPSRRRLAIVLSTIVLLIAGVLGGAAPAQAASGSYKVILKYSVVDGFAGRSIVRASGAVGDVLETRMKYYWYGVDKRPEAQVVVQQLVGKKWKNIAKAKRSGKFGFTYALPAHTVDPAVPAESIHYRFVSKKSAKHHILNKDTSKVFTVTYENPAFYTGLAAQVYAYSSAYCPTVAVHEDAAIAEAGHAGEFLWSKGISVDPAIASYAPQDLQAVALHECAHFHQFYDFGNSYKGDKVAQKNAPAVFVNDVNPATGAPDSPVSANWEPYEHAADCASHAVQPAGYLGYGGYCNPTELAAGLALIQGGTY